MPGCTRFSAWASARFVALNQGQVVGVPPLVQIDLPGVNVAIGVDDCHFFVAEMAVDPTHGRNMDSQVETDGRNQAIVDCLRHLVRDPELQQPVQQANEISGDNLQLLEQCSIDGVWLKSVVHPGEYPGRY